LTPAIILCDNSTKHQSKIQNFKKNASWRDFQSVFFSVIRRRKMSAFSGVRVGIRFDIRFGMSIN
jgi:hypothetical protein